MEQIDYLRLDDAIRICERLGFEIRDAGLFEAALARPLTSVFGKDAYMDFDLKVAALMDSINRNRPLIDGNKRLSWVLAVVFSGLNGFDLESPADEAETFVLSVSVGDLELDEIADWLRSHLAKKP